MSPCVNLDGNLTKEQGRHFKNVSVLNDPGWLGDF